jgi:predicted dehydrogenase
MSSLNTSLGHAIIGCGRISPNHVDAVRHAPPMRLLCAADCDRAAAESFAAAHDVPSIAESLAQVLDNPEIQSISLATPHDIHLLQAHEAVAAGKHVLIEKPPGLDGQAILELQRAAQTQGVVVLPITQHRFDPLVKAVKDLLASEDLGPVRLARCHLECVRPSAYYADSPWRGTWAREGGSVLMNQAYHFVDMLIWLLGPVREARALYGTLGSAAVTETEDTLVATLRFEASALASLAITGAGGGQWNNLIELIGENGAVSFDLSSPARLHRLEMRSKKALKHWRLKFEDIQPAAFGNEFSYYGVSHRAQFQAFVAAIQGDISPRAATLDQAAHVLDTIRALYAPGIVRSRTC